MIIFLAELIPFHIQAHCINHSTSSLPQQSAGKLLPFLPSHMFHTSPATASKFADQYDQVKHMASLILKVLPCHRDYFCDCHMTSCDCHVISSDCHVTSCDCRVTSCHVISCDCHVTSCDCNTTSCDCHVISCDCHVTLSCNHMPPAW